MRCWFLATLAPLIVTEPLSGKGRIHFKLFPLASRLYTTTGAEFEEAKPTTRGRQSDCCAHKFHV